MLQTFHIYNNLIFIVFFIMRPFIFLFVDTWRRDFSFLEDTWMAPTTCSVFLLGRVAEGAAGPHPQTVSSCSDKQGACSSHRGNHPVMSQTQLELPIYTPRAHSCDETEMRIHQHEIRWDVHGELRSCIALHWLSPHCLETSGFNRHFYWLCLPRYFFLLLSWFILPPIKESRITGTQKSFE